MTDQKHRLLEDQLQGLKKDYMKHQNVGNAARTTASKNKGGENNG